MLTALPMLFFTSNVYSPVSLPFVERTLRLEILFEKVTLYFLPDDSSAPSLNHFAISSGVPVTVHSKVAVSPAVTLKDSGVSKMAAGSVN